MDVKQAEAHSSVTSLDGKVRKHIVLTGILQGIGCRPTIFRLAVRTGLAGWVVNTSNGVRLEIEGSPEECETFLRDLPEAIPFPGRIDDSTVNEIPPLAEKSFTIRPSLEGPRSVTPIPPDVAICPECVEELFDPKNPRYLYPFITCTLCGPRFTVVRSFPYDRERTSMADFVMCPRCEREYGDPTDRRFHSQTNSCPECGPILALTDATGEPISDDPVLGSIKLLRQGKILAVKGIGGFHLACDALNQDAVALLRERKGREEKPFAVMMPDVRTVTDYCRVTSEEEKILTSPVAPIVLLDAGDQRCAHNVAPTMGTLGVMLPYSPVHHLLFRHPSAAASERPAVLVMTSGNRSEEPIVRDNQEALDRLADLADAFLLNNREIMLRADDSIVRMISGRKTVFRRSRGMVPGEFKLPDTIYDFQLDSASNRARDRVILGAGGDIKNALAIIKGDRAVPGPHVGDLASPVAQEYFQQSISVLTGYLEAEPDTVALDPHPHYFSNSLAGALGRPVEEVYHHHAHCVSLLLEHGLQGPALFAVFDGTGYGTDGTIWGGEFLRADVTSFSRMAHIGTYCLPGGEAAIREPLRILTALLADQENGMLPGEFLPLVFEDPVKMNLWLEAVRKGINAPVTSSAGRLFDAAAVVAGFRQRVNFEGQAAMWLEGIADPEERGRYPVRLIHGDPIEMDAGGLIIEMARDMLKGSKPQQVAARFHNSMASAVTETIGHLSEHTDIVTVGLTGGCFQNRLLTERTARQLEERGFRVLLHETIPPNDGGIALGQAVCALARTSER
jgi:hydrogenase maturation protein HypF